MPSPVYDHFSIYTLWGIWLIGCLLLVAMDYRLETQTMVLTFFKSEYTDSFQKALTVIMRTQLWERKVQNLGDHDRIKKQKLLSITI